MPTRQQRLSSAHMASFDLTLGFLTIADVPPVAVVQAAARAGYRAAGLRITGRAVGDPWYPVLGDACVMAQLRDTAAATGVQLSNVSGYYLDGRTTLRDSEPVFQAAQALGIPLMVQGCFDADEDRLVRVLRAHCARAQDAGMRVGIEFMRASAVKSLREAQRLLERVDAPNVGLVIDALHCMRSGDGVEALGDVSQEQICLFQVCDAVAEKPADVTYMQEALHGRLYAGEGALPLLLMLQALPPGVEIECEMPCVADRELPARVRAQLAWDATQALLTASGR